MGGAIVCGPTVPIFVLVALLSGIDIPELFPTEHRLRVKLVQHGRARGDDRDAVLAVTLFEAYGGAGGTGLMIALLALRIVAVAGFGVAPRSRRLERLEAGIAPVEAARPPRAPGIIPKAAQGARDPEAPTGQVL